jgi:hypothetical protein
MNLSGIQAQRTDPPGAAAHAAAPACLLLAFNRPDTTQRVFEAIRAARPPRLYVACDGARADQPGEAQRVRQVQSIVARADWPCSVQTLFRDGNLGCRRAVSSAITWFFEQEAEGIVLEDDCVPGPDFFGFCAQLLARYRDDERVGIVCGTALADLHRLGMLWAEEDYVYARYPSVWGWASWRRVWREYDAGMADWQERREDVLALTADPKLRAVQGRLFDRVAQGRIDTWDYQLSYLLWSSQRLAVVPRWNLVENIGFRADATHTRHAGLLAQRARLGPSGLHLPPRAPARMLPNLAYQRYLEKLATRPLASRVLERLLAHAR